MALEYILYKVRYMETYYLRIFFKYFQEIFIWGDFHHWYTNLNQNVAFMHTNLNQNVAIMHVT